MRHVRDTVSSFISSWTPCKQQNQQVESVRCSRICGLYVNLWLRILLNVNRRVASLPFPLVASSCSSIREGSPTNKRPWGNGTDGPFNWLWLTLHVCWHAGESRDFCWFTRCCVCTNASLVYEHDSATSPGWVNRLMEALDQNLPVADIYGHVRQRCSLVIERGK